MLSTNQLSYLRALSEDPTLSVIDICKKLNIKSTATVYNWRRENEEFAEREAYYKTTLADTLYEVAEKNMLKIAEALNNLALQGEDKRTQLEAIKLLQKRLERDKESVKSVNLSLALED